MKRIFLWTALAALLVAAAAPTVDAVWKYKILSITWDTVRVDGAMEGGGRYTIRAAFLETDVPADTFFQNFTVPASMDVSKIREHLDEYGQGLRAARSRADSLQSAYVGLVRNVP